MIIEVLLVEDSPTQAQHLETLLFNSIIDFNLTKAVSIKECLELLKINKYHIILLDLTLPNSIGIATVEVLQKNISDTPFIVVTQLEESDIDLQAIAKGAQDCLFKNDINSYNLIKSIRLAIERHKVRKLYEPLNYSTIKITDTIDKIKQLTK